MTRTSLAALMAAAFSATSALGDVTVVPAHNALVEGNSSSSTLFTNSASSLQVFYTQDLLAAAGIVPGSIINGVSYRRTGGGTTGPAGDTSFAEYNIFASQSFATPAEMTTTFANNVVGPQVQVHSGSVTFLANSMPGGATPNAFGPQIDFLTGYTYTGGSLLLEFRRSARLGSTTTISTDFDSTAPSTAGARMLFNLTSNTAATGTLSNGAHVFQLSYIIPAPSTAALLAMAGLGATRRRR